MERRITLPLMQVAVALMAEPSGRFYGYPLSKVSRVRSGVLYPILDRMVVDGWLADEWEMPSDTGAKKPRRYYTLTDIGRRELGGIAAQAATDPRVANLTWGRCEQRV